MRRRGLHALGLIAVAILGIWAVPGAARGTHTVRASASDSYFSVSIAGPTAVTMPTASAPQRIHFTVTVNWLGAPAGTGTVNSTITLTLSDLEMNPGVENNTVPMTCRTPPPPGVAGVSFVCDLSIDPSLPPTSWSLDFGARPTGTPGTGTTSVSMSTGASAGIDTTFTREADQVTTTTQTTTETTTTPTPATVAAAPAQTVTETFTSSTPPQTETASVSAAADTVSVGLAWPTPSASFDVTGVAIVQGGTVVARAPQSAVVRRLVVVKTRTNTSLKVTIKNPVRGRLVFKIVARKLHGTTRVRATIRQTKRR